MESLEKDTEKTDDMWTTFKDLQAFIVGVVSKPVKGMEPDLAMLLRKHKQNFLTLLSNPPKNTQHREDLRKGITDGVNIPGVGFQVLPQDLIDEAIIISDMYNLNEYMALDLLCTAQQQLPYHPGLTRGLVAVLLYYDGRKALVTTLRALVQARKGISWSLDASEEIIECVTRFTQELMDHGIINRIFSLLESLDLTSEIELLHQNRALGGPRHHHQVVEMFQTIRQTLADTVYCWAAQGGLPREATLRLINVLKNIGVGEQPSGSVDNVTLALEMALLYALDLNVLQSHEHSEETVRSFPLLSDAQFLSSVLQELMQFDKPWQCSGLQCLSQLALAVSIAMLRSHSPAINTVALTDEDDLLAASSIDVFDFLHSVFLQNETIFKEEFYMRRIHTLITNFIEFMPLKVKDMKIRADESCRMMQIYAQEGLDSPSNLPRHFEHLLSTIAELYKNDPLKLELTLEYWIPNQDIYHSSSSRQATLFKFVRLGADMLPSALVPYIKMLSSLATCSQSARHVFNLLMQNDLGPGATVSWNHFFKSLDRYYSNLRQELPPSTDTVYQHRNYPRGITPQEIQGLLSVLAIIRTVAENDHVSRLAMCENPSWSAVKTLLGLVTCAVPIPLKASLLLTLAALARSPEVAIPMWTSLENSQILSTIPSTSSYQPRGVQTELEEIECRNEEFPMTRAFLQLLDVLTNIPIPRVLGIGSRAPGFDPYLNFIVNSVFLRFHNRTYKNPEEKWEVARLCLGLLQKFLMQYEPQIEDFKVHRVDLVGGGTTIVNPLPGYHVMVNLSSKTELLRLILYLIDEGVKSLDVYVKFSGRSQMEETLLSCLTLLNQALNLQNKFLTLLSSSGSSMLLTGTSKLLLGINPRSGKPDHLLNISKYITYGSWLPSHALYGVKILLSISLLPTAQNQLVSLYTSTSSLANEIRHGFVECLEAEGDEQMTDDKDDTYGIQVKTKEAILKLLQQCLNQSAPNLTHFLLGFDLTKDVKKTVFQQPGVLNFPRTCLHSIINTVAAAVLVKDKVYMTKPNEQLLEAAYCMLYSLCANVKTSEPILRFLRSSNNFLCNQLSKLNITETKLSSSELNQLAWLLKMIAVEIRSAASAKQLYQLTKIVNILTCEYSDSILEDKSDVGKAEIDSSKFLCHPIDDFTKSAKKKPLLVLLSAADYQVQNITQSVWEFFDPAQLAQLLKKCEIPTPNTYKILDIKKIHRLLMEELGRAQNCSTSTQRPLVLAEVQEIMKYALLLNKRSVLQNAVIHFMDGWRQVAEVMFIVTPAEVLSYKAREYLLMDAAHLLLIRVTTDQVIPELGYLCSGAVLLLLVNLRHCYMIQRKEKEIFTDPTSQNSLQLEPPEGSLMLLDVILTHLMEWIVRSGMTSQKLRANLYATFLNILSVACMDCEKFNRTFLHKDSNYVSQLDSSHIKAPNSEARKIRESCLDIIVSFGEGLVDMLCHDFSGGHNVCKMLALSCLGMLIEVDPHTSWIQYLSSRGYLKHLIDSLLDADEQLMTMLEVVPQTLAPLYVYESKMAMLCRIASSRQGAEFLLEQGLMGCLAAMLIYNKHPVIQHNADCMEIDFVPSVSSRFIQMLFPALDLCDALLTSLGSDNQSCCVQIQHFYLSHNEMVAMVLRSAVHNIPPMFLKEVARLTGVIARSTNMDVRNAWDKETMSDGIIQLQRIQKLMFALLPRFVMWPDILKDLANTEEILDFLQVACNLMLHARNVILSGGSCSRTKSVIFRPSLGESFSTDRRPRSADVFGDTIYPTLGVVLQQLVQSVSHHQKEKPVMESLLRKRETVTGMNSTELKQILSEEVMGQYSVVECRKLAAQQLDTQIKQKNRELQYVSYLIDNSMFIIWSHLDFYMLQAIPRNKFTLEKSRGVAEKSAEIMWKVSTEDVSQLKEGLIAIFNDSFSKQLVSTKEDFSEMDKLYIELLLRRIKRLIQFVPVK